VGELNSYERIETALRGAGPRELSLFLWRRFPGRDGEARSLARVQLAFHKRFPSDLLKVSPIYGYPALAYGAELEPGWSPTGERRVKRPIIAEGEDWEGLDELDVQEGVLAMAVETVERLASQLEGETPILQTIYSPLTVCEMIGGDRLLRDLKEEPKMVREGLRTIASTMAELSRASLDIGADGVFLINRTATRRLLRVDEYRSLVATHDRRVLRASRGCLLRVLHLHGDETHFVIAEEYPIEAINWSSKKPSLEEAARRFKGLILGGLDVKTLRKGGREEIEDRVREALSSVSEGRLVLAPGCALHLSTPVENLDTVIETVKAYRRRQRSWSQSRLL
jgi:uroporphyrinogen decarboxylase